MSDISGQVRTFAAGLGLLIGQALPAAPYVPAPVPVPSKDAGYLLGDGSIYVAGNDLVAELFERYEARFSATHPGFRFKTDMEDSNLAVAGLTAGKSAMGPIGREAMPQEIRAFVARFGYAPTDILIGYDQSPDPDIFAPGKFPPAVWVNAANPLPKLTVEQAARIFCTGAPGGDLTAWRQLGLGGEWAVREIHIYLPANRDAAYLFGTRERLGGLPFSPRAELLPSLREVMSAVAQDPFGIGIVGYWPPDAGWDRQAELGARVKLVPMAADEEGRYSHAGVGDLYPLAPGIHVLVNRPPGHPMEPWIAEFLRLALSDDGQRMIASMTGSDGFIPLPAEARDRELAKLQ